MSIRFSTPRRWAGFEITPPAGAVGSFKADYIDKTGALIGTDQQDGHRRECSPDRRQDVPRPEGGR